jgi:hypothetical protein
VDRVGILVDHFTNGHFWRDYLLLLHIASIYSTSSKSSSGSVTGG